MQCLATTRCQTLSHHIPSTHHHHPQPTRRCCCCRRVPLSLPIWAKQGLLIVEHHAHASPPTTAATSQCIHVFTAPQRPLDATSPPSTPPYAMLPPPTNSNRHVTTSNDRTCHVTLPNDPQMHPQLPRQHRRTTPPRHKGCPSPP